MDELSIARSCLVHTLYSFSIPLLFLFLFFIILFYFIFILQFCEYFILNLSIDSYIDLMHFYKYEKKNGHSGVTRLA